MFRRRKTIVILVVIGLLGAGIWYLDHRAATHNAEREARFLAWFQQSFKSGAADLIGAPQLTGINRLFMSEYGYGSLRAPGVKEYVVTAKVKRGDKTVWGRWLYTCSGDDLVGIYMHSYSEADEVDALPQFPFPLQTYIPWTAQMIDGIPSTAGPSASKIKVSSPLDVANNLIISASAPTGTTCRIEVFPTGAIVSGGEAQKSGVSGVVQWKCRVDPKHKGSQLALKVHCASPRGSLMLENAAQGPQIEVLP